MNRAHIHVSSFSQKLSPGSKHANGRRPANFCISSCKLKIFVKRARSLPWNLKKAFSSVDSARHFFYPVTEMRERKFSIRNKLRCHFSHESLHQPIKLLSVLQFNPLEFKHTVCVLSDVLYNLSIFSLLLTIYLITLYIRYQ